MKIITVMVMVLVQYYVVKDSFWIERATPSRSLQVFVPASWSAALPACCANSGVPLSLDFGV